MPLTFSTHSWCQDSPEELKWKCQESAVARFGHKNLFKRPLVTCTASRNAFEKRLQLIYQRVFSAFLLLVLATLCSSDETYDLASRFRKRKFVPRQHWIRISFTFRMLFAIGFKGNPIVYYPMCSHAERFELRQ